MAVVTRWFSTVAAGTGDGTSWANRAQLVSGATWSSVITGFNFSLGDSLEARIGPGTYPFTTTLASGFFANQPTRANRLYMIGSDSSGIPIQPVAWTSPEPTYPSSNYPLFTSSSGVGLFSLNFIEVAFVKAVVSSNGSIINGPVVAYCDIENTANNASAGCVSFARTGGHVRHSRMKCSGTSYGWVCSPASSNFSHLVNCRIEGNPLATSGSRSGIAASSWQPLNFYQRLVVVNNPGTGIHTNAGSPQWYGDAVSNCIISNNGRGIYVDPNSGLAYEIPATFDNNFITGNLGYGIEFSTNNGEVWLLNNRFRNNGTADYDSLINVPFTSNYTAAGTDADEFVDAANGDYRIKKTSLYWGKNIGAGDEPNSGSLILPSNFAWVA